MISVNKDRVKKIEKFDTGWVITITEKNWTHKAHFLIPCQISYKGLILELYNNYLIQYQNDNQYIYRDKEFETILPELLEFGIILPKALDMSVKIV